MISMEIFDDFPIDILSVDIIDIKNCILEESGGNIDGISRQIWEGSKSIFSGIMKWSIFKALFDSGNECNGLKDILHSWDKDGVQTIIFYVPTPTIQEIRKKLGGRVNPREIIDRIESSIVSYGKSTIPELHICNLKDENEEIEDIFNVSVIKRELDKDTRDNGECIYLIGLKYNLGSQNIKFYINNTPVRSKGGFILGNSPALKHKLKKGFVSVSLYDRDIELTFNKTDSFSSKNPTVNDNLQYMTFVSDRGENLYLELNRANNPIILESRKGEKLHFSLHKLPYIEEPNDEIVSRDTEIYLSSFFIPKDKYLKRVDLLLLKKDGKNILMGGQYRDDLTCNILAEVLVNLEDKEILVKNRSNGDLIFSDYNKFWKLEESSVKNVSNSSDVVTDFDVITYTTDISSDLVTGIGNITDVGDDKERVGDSKQIVIKQGEEFSFKIDSVEFVNSNVSFDKTGVIIRYTDFNLASFTEEFFVNRMNPRIDKMGTIIDCFIKPIERGKFESGGKVYPSHTDILGRAISSKPINFKQVTSGLEIESRLDPRGYVLQISTHSAKQILGDRERKTVIKDNELIAGVSIEIINKKFLKRPLLELTVKLSK